ncbi:MAG: ABC transporter substrate-binding protein [Lachnospiraceae bacterium]
MKIKKLMLFLLTGITLLSLAACSETEDNSNPSDKITIWAWDESFNIKAVKKAAEVYAEVNPNVEVEVVTMAQDDIVAMLNISLSSGAYDGLPDIVLIEDYRVQGYLTAYQDDFSEMSDIASADDFAEYKTGVNIIDGKMYGIPFDSGVAAVFYRLDLVEEAGYTQADMEDLTWDKYIEIGKAIKEKTGINLLTLDPSEIGQIRMMLQSAGAWYTDEDGNADIADNQALKDAITTYKELIDAGIVKTVSDWNQFVGAFNNGEVASVPTGCWISPSVTSADDQSGKWAIAAFPKMAENPDSINASSFGGSGWYVLKNVGNEEVAKDFLKETFASNVDLMNQLVEEINLVSTLTAASEAENYSMGVDFYGGQEIFKDFAAWTDEVSSVNYGKDTYYIEDMMTEAVQRILNGADMDKTLSDCQTQVEAAVANGGRKSK